MQMAATDGMVGSPGFGWMPFAHSARTLPGVSFPSSVVRSIIRIARSRAHTFEAFLMLRFCSCATRSSAATWSTGVTRPRRLPSVPGRGSQARTRACAWSRASVSRAAVAMGRRGYTALPSPPDGLQVVRNRLPGGRRARSTRSSRPCIDPRSRHAPMRRFDMAEAKVGEQFIKHELDEAIAIQRCIVQAEEQLGTSHPDPDAQRTIGRDLKQDQKFLQQLEKLGKPHGATGEVEEVAGGMQQLMQTVLG